MCMCWATLPQGPETMRINQYIAVQPARMPEAPAFNAYELLTYWLVPAQPDPRQCITARRCQACDARRSGEQRPVHAFRSSRSSRRPVRPAGRLWRRQQPWRGATPESRRRGHHHSNSNTNPQPAAAAHLVHQRPARWVAAVVAVVAVVAAGRGGVSRRRQPGGAALCALLGGLCVSSSARTLHTRTHVCPRRSPVALAHAP